MVYYRKYRPQTLDEMIGQEHIKQTLKKAIQDKKLAHAYLFCGPRGSGKTSTARILAKIVNCESKDAVLPCNTCATCLSITDGSCLDLMEIDAASNRGIDDVRSLKENIKLSASSAAKKVYIIDEVHMLTTEAFNALLKTLEEPPSHVLFILATTEVQKVPATILSRVQRLDFKSATAEDLLTALKRVAEKEKITADEAALQLIAKKAEGSFRDSLKILDQVSSQDEKVTIELVERLLQGGSFESGTELLKALAAKNPQLALGVVLQQIDGGINVREYLLAMMDLVRSLLFMKHGQTAYISSQMDKDRFASLTNLEKSLTSDQLLIYLDLFQQAFEKLKFAAIPSLPLEVAVVACCFGGAPKAELVSIQTQPQNIAVIPINEARLEAAQSGNDNIDLSLAGDSGSQVDDQVSQAVISDELVLVKDKWTYILETIKPANFSLEALLRSAQVTECSEGVVLLEVPYAFHQRILETPKSRNLLESVLTDVLGKTAKVRAVLGKRQVKREELSNVEVAADDEIIRIAAEIFSS